MKGNYGSHYQRYLHNLRLKKQKRKIFLKRIAIALTTVLLTIGVIFGFLAIYKAFYPEKFDSGYIPSAFGKNVSKRVKKAEELQLPDWIDEQLIKKHGSARTGLSLVDIKNIVIHYVGNPDTTAQNNRDYFNKSDTEVSSHFVVGLEGEIIQCVPLYERSAASNHRNKDTISIEVCHPDETGKYSDKTYFSLIRLVAYLLNEFSLDENDVIRHYDITGKECPLYYVKNEDAWNTLITDVEEKLDEYKAKD